MEEKLAAIEAKLKQLAELVGTHWGKEAKAFLEKIEEKIEGPKNNE